MKMKYSYCALLCAFLSFAAGAVARAAGPVSSKPIPYVRSWLWDLEDSKKTGNPPPGAADVVDYDPKLGGFGDAGAKPPVGGNATYRICYFSAGSYEGCRPDLASLRQADVGKPLTSGNEGGEWKCQPRPGTGEGKFGPAELWLDYSSPTVREVMMRRLDDAMIRGCYGVEPDNIDAQFNDSTGFRNNSAQYFLWLAKEAHARGLAIALKNTHEILSAVAGAADFAVVEECYEKGGPRKCEEYLPIARAGKAVLIASYTDSPQGHADWCKHAKKNHFTLTFFPKDQFVRKGIPCPNDTP